MAHTMSTSFSLHFCLFIFMLSHIRNSAESTDSHDIGMENAQGPSSISHLLIEDQGIPDGEMTDHSKRVPGKRMCGHRKCGKTEKCVSSCRMKCMKKRRANADCTNLKNLKEKCEDGTKCCSGTCEEFHPASSTSPGKICCLPNEAPCTPVNDQTTKSEDCCREGCKNGKCCSINSYDSKCTSSTECCDGNCGNSKGTSITICCTKSGDACVNPDDCCSGTCVNRICKAYLGDACTKGEDCANGGCSPAGQCCKPHFEIKKCKDGVGETCCSGKCLKDKGDKTLGHCCHSDESTLKGKGETCSTDLECCGKFCNNNVCDLEAPPGV